jgi:hypothetical protein
MKAPLGMVVGLMALCANDPCTAQAECVWVRQAGRSLAAIGVWNDCGEPVTVTLFTIQGTEVINVPARSNVRLTMLKVRRWHACRGVSVTDCPQSN